MFERLFFQAYKYQQGDVFSIRPFMQGFQAFPRNISKTAEIDSFCAQLPYKDEESGLNKAKVQMNKLIRK